MSQSLAKIDHMLAVNHRAIKNYRNSLLPPVSSLSLMFLPAPTTRGQGLQRRQRHTCAAASLQRTKLDISSGRASSPMMAPYAPWFAEILSALIWG